MTMNYKEKFEALEKEFENDKDYHFEGLQFGITEQMLAIMERKEISKTKLANLLDCSNAYITKLLRGDQNLTLRKLFDIGWSIDASLKILFEEKIEVAKVRNVRIYDLQGNWRPPQELKQGKEYASQDKTSILTEKKNNLYQIAKAS